MCPLTECPSQAGQLKFRRDQSLFGNGSQSRQECNGTLDQSDGSTVHLNSPRTEHRPLQQVGRHHKRSVHGADLEVSQAHRWETSARRQHGFCGFDYGDLIVRQHTTVIAIKQLSVTRKIDLIRRPGSSEGIWGRRKDIELVDGELGADAHIRRQLQLDTMRRDHASNGERTELPGRQFVRRNTPNRTVDQADVDLISFGKLRLRSVTTIVTFLLSATRDSSGLHGGLKASGSSSKTFTERADASMIGGIEDRVDNVRMGNKHQIKRPVTSRDVRGAVDGQLHGGIDPGVPERMTINAERLQYLLDGLNRSLNNASLLMMRRRWGEHSAQRARQHLHHGPGHLGLRVGDDTPRSPTIAKDTVANHAGNPNGINAGRAGMKQYHPREHVLEDEQSVFAGAGTRKTQYQVHRHPIERQSSVVLDVKFAHATTELCASAH
ncbi:hypothetical protein CF327_g2804 [Tilletia walkeri]|nr:hypothetical protein CF327_g2804 [Tilletia walkeri]